MQRCREIRVSLRVASSVTCSPLCLAPTETQASAGARPCQTVRESGFCSWVLLKTLGSEGSLVWYSIYLPDSGVWYGVVGIGMHAKACYPSLALLSLLFQSRFQGQTGRPIKASIADPNGELVDCGSYEGESQVWAACGRCCAAWP